MRLTNTPDAAEAYTFGLRQIIPIVREYWWLYLIFVALDGIIIAVSGGNTNSVSTTSGSLVIFPVLASVSRLLWSDARMRFIDVLAIIAICLCIFLGALGVVGVTIAVAFFIRPLAFFAFLAAFCAFIWLAVKLAATPLFYLRSPQRNVFKAFAQCFSFVRGMEWWSVFMFDVFVLLTLIIPCGIAAFMMFSGLTARSTAVMVAGVLMASMLNIVATAWAMAGLAAIISHDGRPSSSTVEAVA